MPKIQNMAFNVNMLSDFFHENKSVKDPEALY